MTRALARLVAAAVLGTAATAGLVLPAASPAAAALCGGSSGVNVVVDFTNNPDGGGVTSSCDSDGGGKVASHVFPHAGYPLTYASRQPGFVCRVRNAPSTDPCTVTSPVDAYWALFWSDGSDGRWHYSSTGVGSTKVPAGGSVAFVWQNGGTQDNPRVAPPRRAAAPAPQPAPTRTPTPRPSQPAPTSQAPAPAPSRAPSATTPAPGETAPGSPSAPAGTSGTSGKKGPTSSPSSPEASPSASGSSSPSASTSLVDPDGPTGTASAADAAQPTGDLPETTDDQADDQGGLPLWVIGLVLVGLAIAAGVVLALRRRSTP